MGNAILVGLVVAIPGLLVAISAFTSRRALPPPPLPPAKIEDGRSFTPPATASRVRFGRLGCGVVLIAAGVVIAWFLTSLGEAFDLKLGRPLRVRGRPRLPARRRGTIDDTTRPRLAGVGLWRRASLGARWHAAARTEHASIAAFDELAAQFPELAERCRTAARDERRHARRCYAIASAYAGVAWCAGEMPARTAEPKDVESLAVESFVDGCIGEAISAAVAARGAELATDPVVASSLAMFAADEARHAELGWAIVESCVARGGALVVRRIHEAARTLPRTSSRGPTDVSRRDCAEITARVHAAARAELARRWNA